MSLVYITFHDENIADFEGIVAKRFGHYENLRSMKPKKPSYQSKFRGTIKSQANCPEIKRGINGQLLLTNSHRYEHRTMGVAKAATSSPKEFLRKQEGIKWRRLADHKCVKGNPMPPVPKAPRPTPNPDRVKLASKEKEKAKGMQRKLAKKCCEVSKPSKPARVNFVQVNVDKMKSLQARRPTPYYMDTPVGSRHLLLPSGLLHLHMKSNKFGKVPSYLAANKKRVERIRKECTKKFALKYVDPTAKCEEAMEKWGVRKLTMDERVEIVEGLRANHAETFNMYQNLSLYTDTLAKKLRKGRLETEMRQLETDIELIQNNRDMYVADV